MIYLCMVPSGPAPSGKVKVTMVPRSARVRRDPDGAAVALDDRSREEQAEADALALGGEERLEHVAGDLGIDARAGVGEGYHVVVALALNAMSQLARPRASPGSRWRPR